MSDLLWVIIGLALAAIVYVSGFVEGKRCRKIDLSDCSDDVQSAFLGFQLHESDRHDRDKERISREVKQMIDRGVKPPKNFPIGYWWRV